MKTKIVPAVKPRKPTANDQPVTKSGTKAMPSPTPVSKPKTLMAKVKETAKKLLAPKAAPADKAASSTEVDATTVVRRTYTRAKKSASSVPEILLEGDGPAPVTASGPGEKFSLGATPPVQTFSGGELPESYGTKKLFLTARDPHWLYAHWDLSNAQQKELNGESADGHLILRIYPGKIEGHPAYEIHVDRKSVV